MTRKEEIMQEANTRYSVSHPFIDIAKDSFIEGARWADKTLIEKACMWLEDSLINYWSCVNADSSNFIKDFKKAMEE